MKTSIILLVTALAVSVLASPQAEGLKLAEREVCNHPGPCSRTESGQCEYHCDGYGGFQYMQGCGWFRKRCCCVNPT
ncbi:hypothetical protein EDC01DRAFT_640036 [Geopyxis carbonaria]|nr:hypothetical protein EDC01DRAFT_640036 [Geopyxis carbonaria]